MKYVVKCFERELTSFEKEEDAIQVATFLQSYKLPCLVIICTGDETVTGKVKATHSLEDLLLLITDLQRSLKAIHKEARMWTKDSNS